MHTFIMRVFISGLAGLILCGTTDAQIDANKFPVGPGNLCVTEGAIEKASSGHLAVDVPKMRAYVNGWASQAIEARFTYLGPTAEESSLASGETRRQFGLKLHAANSCNLVYAMWRIGPESKIVISVKSNPGQSKSSECGNHGYRTIKATNGMAVPALRPGDTHTLGTEMNGDELRVFIDRTLAWEGRVGAEAAELRGPVGIRSDNVRLSFDLNAGEYVGVHPQYMLACQGGPELQEE